MNARNAQKLLNALTPERSPTFDYRYVHACVCEVSNRLFGTGLEVALGVAFEERRFLLGMKSPSFRGDSYLGVSTHEATGVRGLKEARRRLMLVAKRQGLGLVDPTAKKKPAAKLKAGTKLAQPRSLTGAKLTLAQATKAMIGWVKRGGYRVSCEPDLDAPGRWRVRAVRQ